MLRALIPLLTLTACAGSPTCDGGGRRFLDVGQRIDDAFEPYGSGDDLVFQDPSALRLDFEVGGLDATRQVTTVLRISVDGGSSEDFLGSANLSCTDGEPASHRAWATLPSPLSDGQSVRIQSVFTDGAGTSVESDLSLRAVDGASGTAR